MKYSIAIAGTTIRTKQCAQALLHSDSFDISWVLTPTAKPVGRKKTITPNPMEVFAQEHKIPTIFVEKKIDQAVQEKIVQFTQNQNAATKQPDFLLVVDFGYIIPKWLLEVPKIAPLNIHPSELPKWRGSSPGQFALLFNEQQSAVTVMVMDAKLDHGPIIHQDFFAVDQNWTQADYYAHAFNLMCDNLSEKIVQFAQNPDAATKQPDDSPTITARQITKADTFVPWSYVTLAMQGLNPTDIQELPQLLQQAYQSNQDLALTLERASKAFNPWPNLWTTIPTAQGEKRMKLLTAKIEHGKFIPMTVVIEGKTQSQWDDVTDLLWL